MIILDSTLREGEQTPNVTFSVEQKLNFAKLMDEFGVEMIEVGHPNVSPQIRNAIQLIAKEGLKAEVVAHVRAVKGDIDEALACEVDRVVIFLPTSDIHLRTKINVSRQAALSRIEACVSYAKDHGVRVRYTPEDSTRTDRQFLIQAIQVANLAGADRASIADTVGIATPVIMAEIVSDVLDHVDISLDVHCHNDLGLALANAIAGVEAGADCVHTTVNGLGERCGIVDLAPLCMYYRLQTPSSFHYRLDLLTEIYEFVEKVTGYPIGFNSPVVGRNAFSHKSGVHTDGVIKNPLTYEPYDPTLIGRGRTIVIDRYTGRLAVQTRLRQMGIEVDPRHLRTIVAQVKAFSDSHGAVPDDILLQIANTVVQSNN